MSHLYARTFKRAAEIVGGEEALAARLAIAPNHLALWLRGLADPPTDAFLKAVDIVSDHDVSLWKDGEAKEAAEGTPPPG